MCAAAHTLHAEAAASPETGASAESGLPASNGGDSSPGGFQKSRMINLHSTDMEWQRLSRLKNGVNMPTAVQSVSAAEAAFYGFEIDSPLVPGKKTFFKPIVRVQPFFTAWNDIDTDRGTKDFALRKRLGMEDEILAAGVSFGTSSFYGTVQFDLSTDELVRKADSSGSLGFWEPQVYGEWMTFPREGYLSWAGENISFTAGRLKTGIGLGDENLVLNGQALWYDNIQFSWWSEKFKFFTLVGSSSSHLSDGEWEVQQYNWDDINNHDDSAQADIPLKMFTYHRFEWKPVPRFGVGITEMQMIGGKVPDLFNLLPMAIWHNTYSAAVTNVMFQADVWALPLDGLLLYGEFLIDDMQSAVESGESKPNCLAWELGALYTLPIDVPGWMFFVSGEYSHADRWTYTRWQPYLTMYQRQVSSGGHSGLDTPLGHSEGGDVDSFGVSFGAVTERGGRVELGYTYLVKGPVYLNQIVEYQGGKNDFGAYYPVYYDLDSWTEDGMLDKILDKPDKRSHCIVLSASWPFGSHFEASAALDMRYVTNARHEKGETAFETIFKTGVLWRW